jgi:hypothetical protein
VKVLDFGIAKLRGDLSGSGAKTQSGSVMGTPPYMSPEQCRGIEEVDHRTDIYALGIILYQMLTGAPPFVSPGWGEVVYMHISQAPPPIAARNPEVRPELEAIIMKALAKLPDARWSSMAELEEALRGVEALAPVPRGARAAPVVGTGAPGGTLVLPTPPTTLRTSVGQVATAPGEDEDAEAVSPARPWWRRPAVRAVAGVAGVAVAGAALTGAGDHSRASGPASLPHAASPAPSPAVAPPSPGTSPSPAVAPPSPVASPSPAVAPSSRALDVRAVPADAEIALDQQVPVRGRLRVTLAADGAAHRLHVSAPGYRARTLTLGPGDAAPDEIRLEAEPARVPAPAAAAELAPRPHHAHATTHAAAAAKGAPPPPQAPVPPASPPPIAPAVATPTTKRGANNALILR